MALTLTTCRRIIPLAGPEDMPSERNTLFGALHLPVGVPNTTSPAELLQAGARTPLAVRRNRLLI